MCPCLEVSSTPSSFFQVLKSQRWEKKQAATKVFGTNQAHQPSAKVGAAPAMTTSPWDNQGTGEVLRSAGVPITSPLASTGPDLCRDRSTSPKAWDPDVPRRCQPGGSRRSGAGDGHVPGGLPWQGALLTLPRSLQKAPGASESCQGGPSQAPGSAGQGLLEEQQAPTGVHTVSETPPGAPTFGTLQRAPWPCFCQAGSRCWPFPSLEVGYSTAKAQRQRLQAQHQLLLQRELGDGAAPGQEVSTGEPQAE